MIQETCNPKLELEILIKRLSKKLFQEGMIWKKIEKNRLIEEIKATEEIIEIMGTKELLIIKSQVAMKEPPRDSKTNI